MLFVLGILVCLISIGRLGLRVISRPRLFAPSLCVLTLSVGAPVRWTFLVLAYFPAVSRRSLQVSEFGVEYF